MKTDNRSLWKLSLIAIVLFSWQTEVNAQPITIDQTKVLSPIVKIISETIFGVKYEIPKIDWNVESGKSYISSSLFLFKENIQLCKDIITREDDNDETKKEKTEIPKQIEADRSEISKEPKKILKKKKSFWNHPGNTKSRI